MKHTLIIGAGASGMAAAIAAAQRGERVTMLDRNRKPLKKLGVTGNGRGNLLNCGQPELYGDRAFGLAVLRAMPYENAAAFLEEAGIPLVHEAEGRMYPASFLAASAVDALRMQAERLGVMLTPNARAVEARAVKGGFSVRCMRAVYAPDTVLKSGRVKPGAMLGEESAEYRADRLIVCAGGAAAPVHGTDGTAYGLLTSLGHRLIPPRPALCALRTEKKPLEGLSGQRVRAALALNGQQSSGEALFAEDGVSGIAAMQLSRMAQPGSVLHMDLRMAVTGSADTEVLSWLQRRAGRMGKDLLVGAVSPPLAQALWRAAGCRPSVSAETLEALARVIADFALKVEGTRGFDSAQVTAGGIDCADFDPATMQSRLCPGLYAAGEMLNVDGGCGGHNLLFAFASGLLAGRS